GRGEVGAEVGGEVEIGVDGDAELVEAGADGFAQPGVVFADAGGEHEGVAAAELGEEGADPVADGVDVDVEGAFSAAVAGEGGGADVAHVVADAGDAEQSALAGELALDLLDGEAEAAVDERDGGGVEVADAVVLRQAGLRAQAHAGADGDAVADGGDGAGAAEVAGDDA